MTTPSLVTLNLVEHDPRGSVAHISIVRPEKLNVLDSALIKQLHETLLYVRDLPTVRVVVLTGAGERAFIGGADLNELAQLDAASARTFITRLHEVCQALRELPMPVIARIVGYCLGAGLEVAASCDLRVAADNAVFGMPEVRVGIPSVIEAALLPRLIGRGKASELVLTGETLTASEAWQCGLVERVSPLAQLDEVVARWVEALLQAGPRALRLQKRLLHQWDMLSLDEAIAQSIETFAAAYQTNEPHEMMQRFLQRRRAAM